MSKRFYDTNGLLNQLNKAFEENFACSSKTLEEIEHIKVSDRKDQDIKFKARKLARLLDRHKDTYEVIIVDENIINIVNDFKLELTPDNLIMASAYYYNKNVEPIIFICDDIVCKVLGRNVFGLKVESIKQQETFTEYKGFKEVLLGATDMAYLYSNLTENLFDLCVNEYLIIQNTENEIVDKLVWTGETHKSLSFKQINNDYSGKIKPKNTYQELAFDLLQNKDIPLKILTGKFGSGKDYLMTSTAIDLIRQRKFDKVMWVRNNVEVKNSKPIGFLPNGMKDKLMPFAMPMADHVGGKDGLELLIQQGKVEIEHLGFIRGRNIENTIIMCSEAENMTKEHIQLLISRIGNGSALWLNGDFKQIDDNVFERNNGLNAVISKLKGNSKFGYVQLQKTERSETAALAELLD